MSDTQLPMPGLECLWHEGEEVATLKSASAIIKWGNRGWVLKDAFQAECSRLRSVVEAMGADSQRREARVKELETENARLKMAMDRYSEDEILNPKQ